MLDWIINSDVNFFLTLNRFHSPFWDSVMWFFSGKYQWIPLYIYILVWMAVRFKSKSVYYILAVIVLITLSDQISSSVIKDIVARQRPCKNPDIAHLVHIVNNYCRSSFGFVSSHAANSFALASFTAVLFKKRWFTVAIYSWAVLVSYSRIYLGVHYPGDIICGALLGVLLSIGIYKSLEYFLNSKALKK